MQSGRKVIHFFQRHGSTNSHETTQKNLVLSLGQLQNKTSTLDILHTRGI